MPHKAFITNSKDAKTLKKRLSQLIEHSKELKFLVGFFYFSGWRELHESLKDREDILIKVLVGLNVDTYLDKLIEISDDDKSLCNEEKSDKFFASLTNSLNADELDIEEFYEQVNFFIELIEENRLIIRKTADPNHAKLYIFKIKDELQGIADTKFITGSSNLTRAGILEQNEFNVEIGDYGTEDAESYFDSLWETAIPITENSQRKIDLINTVFNKTQAATVSPFEAYLLILKTYIDIQEQKKVKPQVIRLLEKRYKKYSYQEDAVNQALTILENYNGVIVADVVGLGKSIIASMIAKNTGKRGLIICPPGLMGDKNAKTGWNKYIHDFQLYDWELRSSGDLEKVSEYIRDHGEDIEVVVIDEAHRFRNQDTSDYHYICDNICRNRQVILLTATPFNNSPADIFSLLKLFIIPGKSKITLDENLEARFTAYNSLFRRLSYIFRYHNSRDSKKKTRAQAYYLEIFKDLSVDLTKVRERANELGKAIRAVIEPVLIRRNRIDLKEDPVYKKEIDELSEMEPPKELFFELDLKQSAFYDAVINEYFGEGGRFKGAIYQPFFYEKEQDEDKLDEEGNRVFQQQRNLYDFMRRLLVKRFESSFGAFSNSIATFIEVHKCVRKFIDNSGGKYILDRKLVEKIYENDFEEIQQALAEFTRQLDGKTVPKNNRIYDVNKFEYKNEFISDIESDIELLTEIKNNIEKLRLVESDPKAERLVKEIESILKEIPEDNEPLRKVIVFTEYVDTVHHLLPWLEKEFDGKVFEVDGTLSSSKSDKLLANFDASIKKQNQTDEYVILLTTDKLSEGVNLNRAGAVINYDIPWNPTRVIQRVGRINRIGKKVFKTLRIYNFFPTEKGADIVKSRQIASQKMFLIHNTLGEDAKIFELDETPTASALYTRINANPEDMEDESLLTKIRKLFFDVSHDHPEIVSRIVNLPARVKTAKSFDKNCLTVFRRKKLGLFIQNIEDTSAENPAVKSIMLEQSLPLIECGIDEPRLKLSLNFWKSYEKTKNYSEVFKAAKSDISLEVKALNNLHSSLQFYKMEIEAYIPFIRMLIEDLRDYLTLSKYSIRRLATFDLQPNNPKALAELIKALDFLKITLGENYLDTVKARIGSIKSEIIIAVENIKG